MLKNKLWLAILTAIIFFTIGIITLSDYGIIWDAPTHYWRGQSYLRYIFTGEKDYRNLQTPKRSFFQDERYTAAYYLNKKEIGHPPLNDILAAVSNQIFYQKLRILGDVESHHLFILFVCSFLVFVVFCFTQEVYGLFAAVIAFLSLTLYPLFSAESRFNIKDPVEASFYGLTIYTFYKGIKHRSWKWIIASSVSAGFALGTKFNVVFAGLTILFWLAIYYWPKLKLLKWPFSFRMTLSFLLYPFIALSILFFSLPNLWQEPFVNFMSIIKYYKEIGYGISYQSSEYLSIGGLNTYPLQWIFFTTPLPILFFSFLGAIYALKHGFKEKNKTSLLILFWFLVPIVRVSLPKMGIYGGARQIMEYIPAMALLSGIGANQLAIWLKKKSFNNLFIQLLILLMFLPITLKLIQIHPNQNVYFNPLIGGLGGAQERNLSDWGNTFGNVYRQGVNWLNKNTEVGSRLVLAVSYDTAVPKIWLRKDIQLSNEFRSGLAKEGEYVMEMTHDTPFWPHFYYFNYVKRFLKPLYEVKVDGVPLLVIWKNDETHTKSDYQVSEDQFEVRQFEQKEGYILVDLEKEIFLAGIEIEFADPFCKFSKEGAFLTSNDGNIWLTHPGNLEEMEFFSRFNPRQKKDRITYLFAGDKIRFIKVTYDVKNSCFKSIEKIRVARLIK